MLNTIPTDSSGSSRVARTKAVAVRAATRARSPRSLRRHRKYGRSRFGSVNIGISELERYSADGKMITIRDTERNEYLREHLGIDVFGSQFSHAVVDGVLSKIRLELIDRLSALRPNIDQLRGDAPPQTNDDLANTIEAWKQDLIDEVISHFRAGDRQRGGLAFGAWKQRFRNFVEEEMPGQLDTYERSFEPMRLMAIVRPGEHPLARFMREDGDDALALLDHLADEARKGRVVPQRTAAQQPRHKKIRGRSVDDKQPPPSSSSDERVLRARLSAAEGILSQLEEKRVRSAHVRRFQLKYLAFPFGLVVVVSAIILLLPLPAEIKPTWIASGVAILLVLAWLFLLDHYGNQDPFVSQSGWFVQLHRLRAAVFTVLAALALGVLSNAIWAWFQHQLLSSPTPPPTP